MRSCGRECCLRGGGGGGGGYALSRHGWMPWRSNLWKSRPTSPEASRWLWLQGRRREGDARTTVRRGQWVGGQAERVAAPVDSGAASGGEVTASESAPMDSGEASSGEVAAQPDFTRGGWDAWSLGRWVPPSTESCRFLPGNIGITFTGNDSKVHMDD